MTRLLRGLAAGALLGAAWGVVARCFMRLLTTQPEFSWEGTLAILGIAAWAGACVGLVRAARSAGRSGWWRLAALPAIILFAGPGSLLLPATVGFALVLRGGRVGRVVGPVLVAATPVVAALPDPESVPTSPTAGQVGGLALLTLAAAPLGWALAGVVRRWRAGPSSADAPVLAEPVRGLATTG
ncbi:MAG TPA: hypothetical protein PKE29_16035 [Phycisphaerales bacterium]|nr:hypothetical protein [Phycisphaerales bacterium]